MEFEEALQIVAREPVFESALLLAGDRDPNHIRRQLSRWVRAGRIYQLRRGLYALAPPFQRLRPHPFVVANRLVHASYVSLQSALAHYDLIPEHAPVVTSLTTGRPGEWDTPLGAFSYRHIAGTAFFGYRRLGFGPSQFAFVAAPEKALLDLVYLTPGGDRGDYLEALRLQNLDLLRPDELERAASGFNRPKLYRAAKSIVRLAEAQAREMGDT